MKFLKLIPEVARGAILVLEACTGGVHSTRVTHAKLVSRVIVLLVLAEITAAQVKVKGLEPGFEATLHTNNVLIALLKKHLQDLNSLKNSIQCLVTTSQQLPVW